MYMFIKKPFTKAIFMSAVILFIGCQPSKGKIKRWIIEGKQQNIIELLNESIVGPNTNDLDDSIQIVSNIIDAANETGSKSVLDSIELLGLSGRCSDNITKVIFEHLYTSNIKVQHVSKFIEYYINIDNKKCFAESMRKNLTKIPIDIIITQITPNYNKLISEENIMGALAVLEKTNAINRECQIRVSEPYNNLKTMSDLDSVNKSATADIEKNVQNIQEAKTQISDFEKEIEDHKEWLNNKQKINLRLITYQKVTDNLDSYKAIVLDSNWFPQYLCFLYIDAIDDPDGSTRESIHTHLAEPFNGLVRVTVRPSGSNFGIPEFNAVSGTKYENATKSITENFASIDELKDKIKIWNQENLKIKNQIKQRNLSIKQLTEQIKL